MWCGCSIFSQTVDRQRPPTADRSLACQVGRSDFCQTNYLSVYQTDLHEICRIGRTLAVHEWSEVIFSIPQGTLLWQPILRWAKSTSILLLVVCMTFARAAPPAYGKKGHYYAGRRQTNYLTLWAQANQLTDQLTIINRRRGRYIHTYTQIYIAPKIVRTNLRRWVSDRLCLASIYIHRVTVTWSRCQLAFAAILWVKLW